MAGLIRRNGIYYLLYYVGGEQKRLSLDTDNLQMAKQKKRDYESGVANGQGTGLPTKTPLPQVLTAYVAHVRSVKKPKSAQTDIYYLREMFGPICEALQVTSRQLSPKAKKRPPPRGSRPTQAHRSH